MDLLFNIGEDYVKQLKENEEKINEDKFCLNKLEKENRNDYKEKVNKDFNEINVNFKNLDNGFLNEFYKRNIKNLEFYQNHNRNRYEMLQNLALYLKMNEEEKKNVESSAFNMIRRVVILQSMRKQEKKLNIIAHKYKNP